MQDGKIANKNIRFSIPQKTYLSPKERIKWLGSAKVTDSLKDFEEFKNLLPKIAENIGRVLRECKDANCIKELIPKIGLISNNTPTKPRHDFGVIEPVNDRDLYYEMLRDPSVSSDKKLGILTLMLFSSDVESNLRFGDPPDLDDTLSRIFGRKKIEDNKRNKEGSVELTLRKIAEDDPRLKESIMYIVDCILNNPEFTIDRVPTMLMLLRDTFNSSFADKK